MWPKDNLVKCYGFSYRLLPFIKKAIVNAEVKWIESSCTIFGENGYGQFHWASCIWGLEESSEIVESITLVSGDLNNQDLTAMVLRG